MNSLFNRVDNIKGYYYIMAKKSKKEVPVDPTIYVEVWDAEKRAFRYKLDKDDNMTIRGQNDGNG